MLIVWSAMLQWLFPFQCVSEIPHTDKFFLHISFSRMCNFPVWRRPRTLHISRWICFRRLQWLLPVVVAAWVTWLLTCSGSVKEKINGKRPRGRSPTRWVDQTKEIIGHSLQEASHAAQDREGWRTTIRAIETWCHHTLPRVKDKRERETNLIIVILVSKSWCL